MAANVRLNYVYRDAGNYKAWGEEVFSNPDGLPLDEIESRLRKAFLGGTFFIASQVGIPEVFLFAEGEATEDDVCFHQFDSLEITNDVPTAISKRSISDFVAVVKSESVKGWNAFDPTLRTNLVG